ncbi:MAG: hypothetical protein RIR97_1188, partial [Pseudomonadota bacterium]
HTTSSDALWAGLPLPTIKGSNFASRVTESLLKNLGLPELVCETDEAYVEKVVTLAQNADERQKVRCKIGDNRFSSPLFDTERFARHLESAFETMVLRAKSGQAPEHFDVAALAPRQAPFKQKRLS